MSATFRVRPSSLRVIFVVPFVLIFISFSAIPQSWFSFPTLSLTSAGLSLGSVTSSRRTDNTTLNTSLEPLCPPQAWSGGHWARTKNNTDMTVSSTRDILNLYGFEECASKREWHLHLGADREHKWYRVPNMTEWEWFPDQTCAGLLPFDAEALVKELVEEGGWLMIGDSITEAHFFTLSCMLYPHVRASYDELIIWDRAWPQHLYLNPTSPLVPYLSFPKGFDIDTTPLITTRRIDLLYTLPELDQIYNSTNPPLPLSSPPLLNYGELLWTLSPSYYLRLFTAPLPQAHYKTLIASTAGHWTLSLFPAFKDDSLPDGGNLKIVAFFEQAMKKWAQDVQDAINEAAALALNAGTKTEPKRVALVRAYLQGHDNCHDPIVEDSGATTEIDPKNGKQSWNWYHIPKFNRAFERVLSREPARNFPDVHFLGIDRPGLLRPDAHVSMDCLHLLTGPGVQEGWTHYIWHYITREVPRMVHRPPAR